MFPRPSFKCGTIFSAFLSLSVFLISAGHLRGQTAKDEEIMKAKPLNSFVHGPADAAGGKLFEVMPAEKTGIGMTYPIEPNHSLARLYPYGWAAGGVAIGDVNGDGKADIFFAGGPVKNRLYLQVGDFQFMDVTARAGISGGDGWGAGVAMADIDNDGDLDIYVTRYAEKNQLFLNNSNGNQVTFEEKAEELHVSTQDGSLNAGFADFDRDGSLDLYVQSYHVEPEGGRPQEEIKITTRENVDLLPDPWSRYYVAFRGRDGKPAWSEAGRPDYLLRNKGFSFFEDFSGASGIALGRAYGTSMTWCDVDSDGNADLYVGNDLSDPDLFYRNSGRRNFTEASANVFPHTPWHSRGTVAADFNNDLLVDLLATNSGGRSAAEDLAIGFPLTADRIGMLNSRSTPQVFRNSLLLNTGAARFTDVAWMAGISHAGAVWSTKAGDFDNDGRIDAFFTNGNVRDFWQAERGSLEGNKLAGKTRWDLLKDTAERREPNLAFRNLGDLRFGDVSNAWGLNHDGMSYSAATGDLDGDGDLDLVVCHAGEPVTLYRNRSTSNRIQLRLEGRKSNTWGIGSEVMITANGQGQLRQLYPQSGFIGSDEPLVHFGLGDAEKVDRLTIRWSSGAVETLEDLPANQHYSITEAVSLIPPLTRARRLVPLFAGANVFAGVGRAETPANEVPQPLAPSELSRLGPGQSWADLDGDGNAELYYGGSRGLPGRLITQSLPFAEIEQPFSADAASEDLGSVFFDADNDGDLDLYVASGGSEAAPGADTLRDRLYLNEDLKFSKAPENHLPDLRDSSGAVAAADFDRDGDVDLFVGSRLNPGAYPTSPQSRLLINDGKGIFTDSASDAFSGMVSSALWSDIDNDGWLDLLIVHDWGAIRVRKNANGRLIDVSTEAGTNNLLGRWKGIAGGDIDQDGDIDYVVTNAGLNTGQSASREQPLPIFYGDLVSDGQPLLLETTRDAYSGALLPRHGWEAWRSVVPPFGEKFPNARAFASAAVGLDGAFPADRRSSALQLTVNTLESGLLINNGSGQFAWRPLPRIAQTGPAYGAVMTDANLDGRVDCYLVQNRDRANHSSDPADSGTSLLLLGTGNPDNPLQPVWPDESGLLVFGPSRSVCAVDLDDDDRADFVVGISEADPAAFLGKVDPPKFRPLKIDLRNPDHQAAGARVTVRCEGMPDQVAEYHAGGGFLSQSPATLFFAAPKEKGASAKVSFRWPDGETTERTVYFD